jgi:hypothetical protein
MFANLGLGGVALGWVFLPGILFSSVSVTPPDVSIYLHAALFRRTVTVRKSGALQEFIQLWVIGILFA